MPNAETIQSVEVDDRLLAGMIGKPVRPRPGGLKSVSIIASPSQKLALVPNEKLVSFVGPCSCSQW